jgi:hypothetical protein
MCCVELFVVYNFWFLLDLLLNPNPIVFFSIFFFYDFDRFYRIWFEIN